MRIQEVPTSLYSMPAGYNSFIGNPISVVAPRSCTSCVMLRQQHPEFAFERGATCITEVTHLQPSPNPIISETEDTVVIGLSKGRLVTVDKNIYPLIAAYHWYPSTRSVANQYYARACINKKSVAMHRFITNTPDGLVVDHIDCNGLNNRLCNLRICTQSENLLNKKKHANNTSGYKGVSWDKSKRRWQATIRFKGKMEQIGRFNTLEEAARAYDEAARKYFGEFARLNFPEEHEQAA